MAEKTLQTRIKLRYASYEEWQSSTLKLLAGEVALCYVPANNDEIKNTAPTVLFKVGDGLKVFSELQWASARAADVYTWAKQSTLPIEKLGSGNVVASISWDAENNKLKYETISVATSEGLEALQNLVTGINTRLGTAETDIDNLQAAIKTLNGADTVDGSIAKAVKTAVDAEVIARDAAIKVESDRAKAAEGVLSDRIDNYETNKDTFALKSDVNTLIGEDSNKSVREITQDEIASQLAGGGTSFDTLQEIAAWLKDHPADVGEMNEKINANTDAITLLNNAETVEGSVAYAVKQEADRAKGVENGLNTRITTIEADYLVEADKTELDGKITTEVSAREAAVKGVSDRVKTLEDANLDTRVKAIENDYLKAADTYIFDCGNYQ